MTASSERAGHGPSLPYSLVAGVTPCRGGWLVASAKINGTVFAPEIPTRMTSFEQVVDARPSFSVIALNAPVGYLDAVQTGGRKCDREARALLGRRGGAVKNAPVRIDVGRGDIDLLGEHVDAITRTLLPRYREVATEMAPYRQRTVYEVNADLSFFQLNQDEPMHWSKRTGKGMDERRAVLEKKVQGIARVLDAEVPGASPAHLLDAAAVLWTARRIFAHAVVRIPDDPQWDEHGLRMELVR
jgi:predicted RNase H-like nuclease